MELGPSKRILPPFNANKPELSQRGPASGPGKQWLWLGLSTLLCVVLILALTCRGSSAANELLSPVTLNGLAPCVLLLVAAFSALVLHEMGHLLAAVACRFEVLNISLGMFRFTRAQSGWRVQGRTRRVFTGSLTALPRSNAFWRPRMMTVIAAGPAATLCTALAAAWLLHARPVESETLASFLRALFQVNLLIFLLGLVPNSSNSVAQNDAGLFVALWKDGAESNAIFLYHLVLQHQRTGLEPREFPLWLVELMATFQGRSDFMVLYAGMVASWAFDRGDRQSGDLWDAHALRLSSRANPATTQACLLNSACFDIVFRNDLDSARTKLNRVKLEMISSPSLQHRALAARDLLRGHLAKSLAEVAAARSFLPAGLQDRGYDCFLLKRLHSSVTSWSVPIVALPATQ